VTSRGEPKIVIMGYRAFENLMEKLEDLSDTVEIY